MLSERLLEGSIGLYALALHRRGQNEGQEATSVFMFASHVAESQQRYTAISVLLSVSIFAFCMQRQPLSEQSGTCLSPSRLDGTHLLNT